MTVFLTTLLILSMGATMFMLIRGVIAFFRTAQAGLTSDAAGSDNGGPDAAGNAAGPGALSLEQNLALKQNRAMVGRILFQGLAVIIIALLLLVKGQ